MNQDHPTPPGTPPTRRELLKTLASGAALLAASPTLTTASTPRQEHPRPAPPPGSAPRELDLTRADLHAPHPWLG